MNLHEIEELIKAIDPKAIKAMMHNAAILDDPNSSEQAKIAALENVKAIATNKKIPKSKDKPVVAPAATQPDAAPVAPTPVTPQIEYPQGLHLSPLNGAGHDEEKMNGIFHALPDHEKKAIADWHTSTNVAKSIDSLYDLFKELKKHL